MKISSTSKDAAAATAGTDDSVGDHRQRRRRVLVKAATKVLKNKTRNDDGDADVDADNSGMMGLVELWRAVQRKLPKMQEEEKGGAMTTVAVSVTLPELRAALAASSDKVELVCKEEGEFGATAGPVVRLVRTSKGKEKSDKKDKKKKKRKLTSTLSPPEGAGSTRDKKKSKKRNSANVAGAGSASESDDTVSEWRKQHKVVVMVEPSPSHGSNTARSGATEVEKAHLVPLRTFDDLAKLQDSAVVPRALLEALSSRFQAPSPIQAQSWPILLNRHNLVGIAETGSGKTLGFCLPALVRLAAAADDDDGTSNKRGRPRPVQMLVLSPTRELAMQSHEVLKEYGKCVGVSSLVVYGGVPKSEQERSIRRGDVDAIVATPGRLKDLIMGSGSNGGSRSSDYHHHNSKGRNHRGGGGGGGGVLDLSDVQYLVLDEADRMLDLGFFPDVQFIVGQCTRKDRQTCLFSATWPASIQQMAATLLLHPPSAVEEGDRGSSPAVLAATVRVYVGFETIVKNLDKDGDDASSSASMSAEGQRSTSSDGAVVVVDDALSANKRVKQTIEVMEDHQRDGRLRALLSEVPKKPAKGEPVRVLVFCLYKIEAERLERRLRQSGHLCTSIHGNKAQADRTQALDKFKTGEIPLLIATDVAARGLHIPNVYMVINYTFPLTIEDYVHRIGRTGRAGQSGLSVTFFQPQQDKPRAGELQQVLRQAGQDVPEALARFGSTIKKKEHKLYGNFGPSSAGSAGLPMKKATKITFNYSDDEEDN